MHRRWVLPLPLALGLTGCATIPAGPSVMVMPSPGKSFETFQAEDMTCRQWAAQQTGIAPSDAANQNLFTSAAIGTLLGAGLGAATGAASGNPGVGAASGAVGGTAVGAGPAYASGWEVQRRYDMAYQQRMYTKGNQLPTVVRGSWGGYWVAAPPRAYYPPPPPPVWVPTPHGAPPPVACAAPPPPGNAPPPPPQ